MKTLVVAALLVLACDMPPGYLPDNLSGYSPEKVGPMTLFESLAVTGHRRTDGSANASGRAWFYKPGTINVAAIYADAAGSPMSNPVTLSAGGKARVYFSGQVDVFFEDSARVPIETLALSERAQRVEVQNPGYTGTLASGSLGAGGVTDLDTLLTTLASSVGGLDGKYLESSGATGRLVGDKFREFGVSVKDFGAVGNGIADDTIPIQTAINEAVRLTVPLDVPAGTYNISATLIVPQVTNGFIMTGAGIRGTKIVQTNLTLGALTVGVTAPTSNDIVISGMTFTATALSSGAGVTFSNSTRPVLRGVRVALFTIGVAYTNGCSTPLVTENSSIVGSGAGGGIGLFMNTGIRLQVTNSSLGTGNDTAASLASVADARFVGVTFGSSIGIASASGTVGLSVVACPTLGAVTTPFSFTGADPGLTQIGNLVEGYTETVLSGGTLVPDWTRGYTIRYEALTTAVAYLINPPNVVAPTRRGVRITFQLYNHVGGPLVGGWTFAAIWHRSATAISVVDTHRTVIVFEYDLDATVWREVSISDTT
jgi:hypothetical protein